MTFSSKDSSFRSVAQGFIFKKKCVNKYEVDREKKFIYTKCRKPMKSPRDRKLHGLSESGAKLVVRRFGREGPVKQERSTGSTDPRVGVRNTPNSDTDTVLDIGTSVEDGDPISGLTVVDIQLSYRALGSGFAKSLQSSRDTRDGEKGAWGAEVGLGADAVNRNTVGNPFLYVGNHTLCLAVVCAVKVVVVNVTLGEGIGLVGSVESGRDEALTEDVVEDTGSEATLLVKDFVYNIPGVDLAGISTNEFLDVVNHDLFELGLVTDLSDP